MKHYVIDADGGQSEPLNKRDAAQCVREWNTLGCGPCRVEREEETPVETGIPYDESRSAISGDNF